jgi:hypothetical protein
MKKSGLKIFLICGFFLLAMRIYFLNQDRIKLDGKKGEILSLFSMLDTKYSDGYTHEKFRKIELGMSINDVVIILGDPLYKWKPYGQNFPNKRNYLGYGYSTSPSSGSYRLRQINFNNGQVAEIISCLYID